MRVLTDAQINRVEKKYDVSFVLKNKSELMELASKVVPIFSKISPDEFLTTYVTTIMDKIYYVERSDLEFDLVVHELTHVRQFQNGSFVRYVTHSGRAYLEGMCKCAEIELLLAIGDPCDIDGKAEILYEYGLGSDEVNVVRNMMKSTEKSFKETGNFSSDIAEYLVKMYNEPA